MKTELSDKTNKILEEMRKGDCAAQKWADELETELVSQYEKQLNNWLEIEKKVKCHVQENTLKSMEEIFKAMMGEINALINNIRTLIEELHHKEECEEAFEL